MQLGHIKKCIRSLPISNKLSDKSMDKIFERLDDLENEVGNGLFDSKYGEFQFCVKNYLKKDIDLVFQYKPDPNASPIILDTYSIRLWMGKHFQPISMKTVFEICDMLMEAGKKKPDSNWQRTQCILAAVKANHFDLANELIAEGPKLRSAELANIPLEKLEKLKVGIYLSKYKTLSKTDQLLVLSSGELKRPLELGIVPKKEYLDKLLKDLRGIECRKKKKGFTNSRV